MISTIVLVTTSNPPHIYHFFFVVRTSQICSLSNIQVYDTGASLVAQWLRICLPMPMQGTRVRALVWEDPTCRGATKPVSHNY